MFKKKTKENDLFDAIEEAKQIIGDEAAEEIADYLGVDNLDEAKMRASCPWHSDSNPSFIWDKKRKYWHCFSCQRTYSILDMYVEQEGSFIAGARKLLQRAGVDYNFKDKTYDDENYFENYVYPREETNTVRDKVEEYLGKRGISKETLDYAGIKQDARGNIVFESRDRNGRLLSVKYRKSGRVREGEPKMWYQTAIGNGPKPSNCPILWPVLKIDTTKPLAVCEGHIDALSIMEAGYTNVVTVPSGASDVSWINFNFEFLEQFETIILWFDNDAAGQNGLHNIVKRLGEYRCKIVKPGVEVEDAVEAYYQQFGSKWHIRKTDANNVLLACGKEKILQLINTAEEIPVKNISYLMDAKATPISDMEKFPMGIKGLDDAMYGNIFPALTIYSGSAGCVDCDTEFFNGTEWKRIADYQPGDKVLQYNEDGTATLVNPEQYHKYPAEYLWHFKTKKGIDQCISEEHNVVYYPKCSNNISIISAKELMKRHNENSNGFSGRFKCAFYYSGDGIDLSDSEIKLMCAVICDGNFKKDSPHSKNCRIDLKKQRKVKKLISILEECGIPYKFYKTKEEYTCIAFEAPRKEKEFTEYWYKCNNHQLHLICDNILFWDGCIRENSKTFSTTREKTRDFVQFAFTACGYRTTTCISTKAGTVSYYNGQKIITKHDCYTLVVNKTAYVTPRYSSKKDDAFVKYKTLDGFKYCFTVPSHMWVMRRNGRICVTGNSGKSSLTGISTVISALEAGEKVWVMSAELPAGMLADWILAPLAGYNHTMEFDSDMYERKYYRLTDQAEAEIRRFYRENILLYNGEDSLETSADDVLDSMEVAYKKFGCRVFLVDNLMSISLDGLDADSKWEAQKKFIVKLANFTNKYGVNVNLVAHPRKPASNNNNIANNGASVYDIAGSSDLGNLCHRMIWISRIKDDTMPPDIGKVKIEIVKDRPTQSAGMSCEAFYDKKTRRIYTNDEEKYRKYSWELNLEEEHKPIQYNAYVEQRLICNKKQEDTLCDQF